MIEKNKIYNIDCFELMEQMEPNMIDLILTSPPYNTSRKGGQKSFDNYENRYDIHLDNKTDEEYLKWSIKLFNLYDKVLKPNGAILYNISYSSENTTLIWKFVYEIITKTGFITADTIVWKKKSALPNNTSSNKLTRICEWVFVFARETEINTFYMNKPIKSVSQTGQKYYESKFNFIEAPNNDGPNPFNKATFSTELVEKLLSLYSKPNNLIYDSFMGTGTTAVACVSTNMNFIGSELSQQQCEYAQNRLKSLQLKL